MIDQTGQNEDISIEEDIDSIFKETSKEPEDNFNFSLHILRRDVERCLGTGFYKDKVTSVSYWPGICAILSGIDLIATYYAPVANPRLSTHSTQRFKGFCNQIFHLNDENDINEAFYQFRCGMLHNYSLVSISTEPPRKKYCFNLSVSLSEKKFIKYDSTTDHYTVYIFALYESFDKACLTVRNRIKRNCNNTRFTVPIKNTIRSMGITFYDPVTSGCMVYFDPAWK